MAEEKKEKEENTKEKDDWLLTLLAPGVKSADSDVYAYDVDLNEYTGDKIALIRRQEQRAKNIIDEVAKKEFPSIEYDVDDYKALWNREIVLSAHSGLRSGYMFFADNDGSKVLHILKDEVLQKRARQAFNELVFGSNQ